MKLEKRTSARLSLLAVISVSLLLFWQWSWLTTTSRRLQSLEKYRIYDPSVVLDTAHPDRITDWNTYKWRVPRTRRELLRAEEYLVMYPKKARPKPPPQPAPKENLPTTFEFAVPIRESDRLDDFVVDFGEWYHHPASWDELNEAARSGFALRTSDFFSGRFGSTKPFLGEIPPYLCYSELGRNINAQSLERLRIWKDDKFTEVSLPTHKAPRVSIVAGWGVYDAQKSVYEDTPPISYRGSPYWAAIHIGHASNVPVGFVVDRITIDKQSAEILLHQPKMFGRLTDMDPHWLFVPLGQLPDGKFAVNVFVVDREEPFVTVTTSLRRATAEEESLASQQAERQRVAINHRSNYTQKQEWETGAELQMRLERLAEFVDAAEATAATRRLLAQDIVELGEQVSWDWPYEQNRYRGRQLEAPTPGKSPKLRLPAMLPAHQGPWKPSDIALKDIWLCDGTDAGWFAERTYRVIPEFQKALVTADPTPTQVKIKEIWQTLESKINDPKHERFRGIVAGGTIGDALEMAHSVIVGGGEPSKTFSADTPIWAVMVAEKSFLVRGVDTSYAEIKSQRMQRTEFRVNASGFIGKADNLSAEQRSPITLALIPLGKLPAGHSASVSFTCVSLCCQAPHSGEPQLLDVKPEDLMLSKYNWYLGHGTGFQIEP